MMNPFALLIFRFIASGLGSGFAPFSPGTFGSVAACIAWAVLPLSDLMTIGIALTSLGIVGFIVSSIVMRHMPSDADPQWIVIDEWCGMWIALACCPSGSPQWMACAFLLFRLFDITKFGPVGWAERARGAAGVMLDDVVAGLCAGGLVLLARSL